MVVTNSISYQLFIYNVDLKIMKIQAFYQVKCPFPNIKYKILKIASHNCNCGYWVQRFITPLIAVSLVTFISGNHPSSWFNYIKNITFQHKLFDINVYSRRNSIVFGRPVFMCCFSPPW